MARKQTFTGVGIYGGRSCRKLEPQFEEHWQGAKQPLVLMSAKTSGPRRMLFEVTPEQIANLADEDLRILVGRLAELEAAKQGHPVSGVTYGGHQNAKDGGIDVRVDLGNAPTRGYVPRSATGYQVKAEDMPRTAILAEMRQEGVLRDSIRLLGEAGGSYIIVSSKGSLADKSLSDRKNAMAAAIADVPSASGLHLDFYDRRRVATWVNQNPGLIPWVRSRSGFPLSGWQSFKDWSSSPGKDDEEYVIDDGMRLIGAHANDQNGLSAVEGTNALRNTLRSPQGIVRLVGLSGVGKTRFAQALFDSRVGDDALDKNFVVYTDMADQPDPVPLELVSRLQHLGQRCIIVVDNCGMELHRKLAARVREAAGQISLITIEYDISDDEPEGTDVYRLEPSSSDVIAKILERKHPNLTHPEIGTITDFSEGNARVALALADTAKDGGSLANLKDSELFTRLFRQKNADDPALLRAAKALSLVFSFDGETLEGEGAELPILAALAEQSPTTLHGHVAELYRRMLIQKRSEWRALLPHALAHRLAKQALQDIPKEVLQNNFISIAPERLIKSFSRRLGSLHDSNEAQSIVADWLRNGGWLSEIEKLTDLGVVLLENVAPVHPEATLKAIEEAAHRTTETLTEDSRRQQHLLRLVRSLAYDPVLFERAMDLIVVAAGNSTRTNNTSDAISIYKSLFYLWLSGTHATAKQRTEFVKKVAIQHPDRPQLVMEALDALLECQHFSSHYNFEFGTRKRDYGLNLRMRADIQAWYDEVLVLCLHLGKDPNFQKRVRAKLASEFRPLATQLGNHDSLIQVAEEFANNGGWPEAWAGVRGAARELKKAGRLDEAARLVELEAKLQPISLAQRIASYVLPEQWEMLDLAEIDDFEDEKRYEAARLKIDAICEEIGAELGGQFDELRTHLPTILESRGNRAPIVIASVAKHSSDAGEAWKIVRDDMLIAASEGRNTYGPVYFVRGLKERDADAANKLLDEALSSPELHSVFVAMQAHSGVDHLGAERLIQAAEEPTVPTNSFLNLMYGRACDELTGPEFKRVIMAILRRNDGVEAAAEVTHMRIFTYKSDKKALSPEDLEAGREVLRNLRFEGNMQRVLGDLGSIAKACLVAPRDDALAREICTNLRGSATKWGLRASEYGPVIEELARKFPFAVLDILLEGSGTERRSLFRSFSESRPSPLRAIDDNRLLEWAHAKPETRFSLLAETIGAWGTPGPNEDEDDVEPNPATGALTWTSAAMRLIEEAPDPAIVLAAFGTRLRPSSWSGSLADKLANRLPLIEALATHSDARVATWATNAMPEIQNEISRIREAEAARDRERDEKFDW